MAHEITEHPISGVESHADDTHFGVYDHGAHVWAWQPAGHDPVVWMSERARFEDGKAIRGGVPICFPWFGPGRDGDLRPAHGFARITKWRRTDVSETDGALVVEYELDETITGEQPNWPHPYRATFRASFGRDELAMSLTVENTGEKEFSFEEALHTYLSVGDVRSVRITGLEGAEYLDKVTGERAEQVGEVEFTSETDRIYSHPGELVISDPTPGRRLTISKEGSANTVVWNPWIAKAEAMADFGDDEWTGMLCIEAGNVLDDAITLVPGERHEMVQRITVAADRP